MAGLADSFPIMGLDLATVSGWAILPSPDARIISGIHTLPPTGKDYGRFCRAYRKWLCEALEEHRPKTICFEKPILRRDRKTNLNTMTKLIGLAVMTEICAGDYGARYFSADVSAIKLAFSGNGHASKKQMVARCRQLGIEPADDNEADAIAVLWLAVSIIAPDVASTRTFQLQPGGAK